MSAVAVNLGISLELNCGCAESLSDAAPLYLQMRDGRYDEMSVMPLPATIDEWRAAHGTARKRAARANARGYQPGVLERHLEADAIHAINTSAKRRQGRPMSAGYLERHEHAELPDYNCERHAIRTTGVWTQDGTLVAYLTMIRAGNLALVSQILGHDAHLKNEIMFLLFEHALQREIAADPQGVVVYNRHDSGTRGLQWHKERLGFRPVEVEWLP